MDVSRARRLRRLRDLNTDDMLKAAALVRAARALPELRRLFDGPALSLARRLDDFDQAVLTQGAGPASLSLLDALGQSVVARGAAVLTRGPRLFVSNHPGLGDILALLSLVDQQDLRIVARDRDFLRALPSLSRRLLLVPETGGHHVLKVWEEHLRSGGAVLTFPAGRIEPDPAWFPPASWDDWSRSTELLARRVPGLRIQPFVVSGVRARAFVKPWAAQWRRTAVDREWTAAVLQLAYQVLGSGRRLSPIQVAVGEPLEDGSVAELKPSLTRLARPLEGSRRSLW